MSNREMSKSEELMMSVVQAVNRLDKLIWHSAGDSSFFMLADVSDEIDRIRNYLLPRVWDAYCNEFHQACPRPPCEKSSRNLLEEAAAMIKSWARYLVESRGGNIDDYVFVDEKERHGRLVLFTPERKYVLVFRPPDDKGYAGYLGGQCLCRKLEPGEDWERGHDLLDGPFNKETFDSILRNIIATELVPLSRPVRCLYDAAFAEQWAKEHKAGSPEDVPQPETAPIETEKQLAEDYRLLLEMKDRLWALRKVMPTDRAQLTAIHDEVMSATRAFEAFAAGRPKEAL